MRPGIRPAPFYCDSQILSSLRPSLLVSDEYLNHQYCPPQHCPATMSSGARTTAGATDEPEARSERSYLAASHNLSNSLQARKHAAQVSGIIAPRREGRREGRRQERTDDANAALHSASQEYCRLHAERTGEKLDPDAVVSEGEQKAGRTG